MSEEFDSDVDGVGERVADMPPALYWEWRCTLLDQQLAEKDFELEKAKHEILSHKASIAGYQVKLNNSRVIKAGDKVKQFKGENVKMKERIEGELGIEDLSNLVICEDLVIRKLDQGGDKNG